MIPLWAVLGLLAALLSTAIPLIQERMKGDGFAIAFWVKVSAVVLTAPAAFYFGIPSEPKFYMTLAATALLWCVSDVIYFRAVPLAGAGVVSRLLPSAVLISFVLWFFVDTTLLDKYLSNPALSSLIVGVLLLATFFAVMVKRDPVSWQGVRLVWFVIFAACVGPVIDKLSLGYAPVRQAPYAFMFFQGLMMIGFWGLYYAIKKPLPLNVLFSPAQMKTGGAIGLVGTIVLTLKTVALADVEQPAYLSVLLFTDALWIILYYRLIGKHESSNIWAGLGIVGCAIALIVLKQWA
jgi:hypothetical protein